LIEKDSVLRKKVIKVSAVKGISFKFAFVIAIGMILGLPVANYIYRYANKIFEFERSIGMYISSGVSIIVSIIIILTLVKLLILNPLNRLLDAVDKVSNGDLTVQEQSIIHNSQDEIGRLSIGFYQMIVNLRGIMCEVAEASEQVAASSEKLNTISEQSKIVSEHISSFATEVTQNTEEQLNSVYNTISTIEEITASIEELSANTEEVKELSIRTIDKSNEGKQEIVNLVEQISNIYTGSKKVQEALAGITSSSKRMHEISNVIRNISDQTNLLALNAAIESARAGEAGRGFAVVAEEVRKLAEQSQKAILEINKLINENQLNVEKANALTSDSIHEVEKGTKIVNKTEKTFEEIITLINQVNLQLEGITESNNQAAKNSQMIVEDSYAIKKQSELVTQQIQNVTASSEEQTATMEKIVSFSQSLASLAIKLQEDLVRFKLS
jgi:methyl-accepting chemotaxis protein